jgi:hypothetical protein
MSEFIFMLTHHDRTVRNAAEVLASVRGTGLRYVGFKDIGTDPDTQRELTAAAHGMSMEVMLEVVSTSAEAELASLRSAVNAGVDWVLGGTHVDDGERVLAGHGLRYCPFPGQVVGHPSVLHGDVETIAADAAALTARPGVHGLDLLAYRHRTADVQQLVRAVVAASSGPLIVAGSVARPDQIRTLATAGAWAFTIGSAIFEGRFPGGPDIAAQVRHVLHIASA